MIIFLFRNINKHIQTGNILETKAITGTEESSGEHFEKTVFNAMVSLGIRLNSFIGGQSKFSILISVS